MNVRIESSWKQALATQWDEPYFERLTTFVKHKYATTTVYPPAGKIFAAFDACPFEKVKVVIIGQDPYHGAGQANGFCFSVNEGIPLPPSLLNIYKEIIADVGTPGQNIPKSGCLDYLAAQGVLLLNATLTVDAHNPASHQGKGWETFTDAVIERLNADRTGLVFLLWGSYAINKGRLIDRSRHLVLTSAHPSPLSAYRGFFGNHHFSQANAYLEKQGKNPIRWL